MQRHSHIQESHKNIKVKAIIYTERTYKVLKKIPCQTFMKQITSKNTIKFSLCWLTTAEQEACPWEGSVSLVKLYWRKVVSHLLVVLKWRQLQVRDGGMCPLLSGLGLHLPQTHNSPVWAVTVQRDFHRKLLSSLLQIQIYFSHMTTHFQESQVKFTWEKLVWLLENRQHL